MLFKKQKEQYAVLGSQKLEGDHFNLISPSGRARNNWANAALARVDMLVVVKIGE